MIGLAFYLMIQYLEHKSTKKSAAQIERMRQEKEFEECWQEDKRKKRLYSYKYEEVVFEIFDTRRELTEDEILTGIMSKLNVDQEGAARLFEEWSNHGLIGPGKTEIDYERKGFNVFTWQVGYILSRHALDLYNKDEFGRYKTHHPRQEWLARHGKELEPPPPHKDSLPF